MPYELIYWPGIPGRGEFIRLALEEGGAEYTDTAQEEAREKGKGMEKVAAQIDPENVGDEFNPPPLAPPILKHGDLVISQMPNILLYLGPKLGLVPSDEGEEGDPDALYRVNALALTALDGLCNEVHDCHHPIASGLYYEDQKEEALRKSQDFVRNRLPKFLAYFERVLKGKASGDGPWLYGGRLTYADLVLFQVSLHCFEFLFACSCLGIWCIWRMCAYAVLRMVGNVLILALLHTIPISMGWTLVSSSLHDNFG